MEYMEQNNELIGKIISEAEEEAAQIIREAEKEAEEKVTSAEKKKDVLMEEARARTLEQIKDMNDSADSKISMEKKRILLHSQEQLYASALTGAKEIIEEQSKTAEYRQTVKEWVVEAAAGLGTEKGVVSGGKRELKLLDDKLLKEAGKEAAALTGTPIELRPGTSPLPGTGIRIEDPEGRLAWDNRLSVRLKRKEQEIRRTIARVLDKKEEQST